MRPLADKTFIIVLVLTGKLEVNYEPKLNLAKVPFLLNHLMPFKRGTECFKDQDYWPCHARVTLFKLIFHARVTLFKLIFLFTTTTTVSILHYITALQCILSLLNLLWYNSSLASKALKIVIYLEYNASSVKIKWERQKWQILNT